MRISAIGVIVIVGLLGVGCQKVPSGDPLVISFTTASPSAVRGVSQILIKPSLQAETLAEGRACAGVLEPWQHNQLLTAVQRMAKLWTAFAWMIPQGDENRHFTVTVSTLGESGPVTRSWHGPESFVTRPLLKDIRNLNESIASKGACRHTNLLTRADKDGR